MSRKTNPIDYLLSKDEVIKNEHKKYLKKSFSPKIDLDFLNDRQKKFSGNMDLGLKH